MRGVGVWNRGAGISRLSAGRSSCCLDPQEAVTFPPCPVFGKAGFDHDVGRDLHAHRETGAINSILRTHASKGASSSLHKQKEKKVEIA